MELKKITSIGPQQMLDLGRWTLDAPEESRQLWLAWKDELGTRQAAREQADGDLTSLMLDHRRLAKLEADTFKSTGAAITSIRSEAIRNPACDFDALASLEAKATQRARFVTSVLAQLVTSDIPKAVAELARATWQQAEADAQCWIHATGDCYGEYLKLLEPLAAAQGVTETSRSPKMIQYEERMLQARNNERLAHEAYIKAESDWDALAKANSRAHI